MAQYGGSSSSSTLGASTPNNNPPTSSSNYKSSANLLSRGTGAGEYLLSTKRFHRLREPLEIKIYGRFKDLEGERITLISDEEVKYLEHLYADKAHDTTWN